MAPIKILPPKTTAQAGLDQWEKMAYVASAKLKTVQDIGKNTSVKAERRQKHGLPQ